MRLVVLLLFGASVSVVASSVAETKAKLVTEIQVSSWLKAWQKRLHLDDWRIEARIVRSSDLKPETLGNLKWNVVTHTATIKVLNPIDYDLTATEIPEDIEYTIVHELVHLQLSALPRDLNKKDVEENVVNKISDALMGLDKGPAFRARSVSPAKIPGKPAEPDVAGRTAPPPPQPLPQ